MHAPARPGTGLAASPRAVVRARTSKARWVYGLLCATALNLLLLAGLSLQGARPDWRLPASVETPVALYLRRETATAPEAASHRRPTERPAKPPPVQPRTPSPQPPLPIETVPQAPTASQPAASGQQP
ncbi:MAG: hypothetical protein WA840_22635, partial [Caulobacteraceae bacterium]